MTIPIHTPISTALINEFVLFFFASRSNSSSVSSDRVGWCILLVLIGHVSGFITFGSFCLNSGCLSASPKDIR